MSRITKAELVAINNRLATENANLRAENSKLRADNQMLRAKSEATVVVNAQPTTNKSRFMSEAEKRRVAMEAARALAMRTGRLVRVCH